MIKLNLPYEYEVLAARPYNPKCPDDSHLKLVLVKLDKGQGEWVTWVADINSGECFWGTYCPSYEDGLVSFDERVARK